MRYDLDDSEQWAAARARLDRRDVVHLIPDDDLWAIVDAALNRMFPYGYDREDHDNIVECLRSHGR